MPLMPERVLLAEPRGFCAGVEMAIKALTWMVRVFEPPVYCYHEIVHNAAVVAAFERAGVVFVDDVSEVPIGRPVMLSAHGSAPEVVAAAGERAAVMVDAVCPLVTKVHHEVKRMAADGYDIIYVGHEGHDEAVGTVAEAPQAVTLVDPDVGLDAFSARDDAKVALLAQTTLGMFEWEGVLEAAQQRFPDLWTARRSDLCYATTNRQAAVQKLAAEASLVLVVGSENSSNTQALVRVARMAGVEAHRIDGPDEIRPEWLAAHAVVGVTSGASAPDQRVREVVAAVAAAGGTRPVRVIEED
jgi:4-hydroxy-3-methylbut-2-enyl diphosphate reductase